MNIGSLINEATTLEKMSPKLSQLKKAAQDVEAIFLKDLLGAMQKSIPKNDIGDNYGADIYQDLFNQAMAQSVSKGDSFGIGKILYKSLSKAVIAQEKARLDIEAEKPTTDN
jgi:Rod binding domain-containing protein